MRIIGIYKIVNLVNGKNYVGQSVNIHHRWCNHKWYAKHMNISESNFDGYNSILHQAFRKYGIENFRFEIIEERSVDDLDSKEQYWIQQLNTILPNGYNILKGGQFNRCHKQNFCTECHKPIDRGSIRCTDCDYKNRRKLVIDTEVFNHIKSMLLNKKSMSEVAKVFKCSEKTLRKSLKKDGFADELTILHKKASKDVNIANKYCQKRILKYDVEGNLICSYRSIVEASKLEGIHENLIRKVLYGKLRKTHGFMYKFASD